jgi:hypothetical protein
MPLEITLGLRWDYSRLDQKPDYNPAVEAAFGRRTDITPDAMGFSPRVGFNYRLNAQGEPPKSLSGGIGLFAGRSPINIYSTAVRQTGLPNAEQRLSASVMRRRSRTGTCTSRIPRPCRTCAPMAAWAWVIRSRCARRRSR